MSCPNLQAPRRVFVATVAVVALVVTACGGSGDPSTASSTGSSPTDSSAAPGPDEGAVDLGPTRAIDPDDAPLADANGPGPAVDGGLYDVPDPLPAGAPGEVIASEPLTDLHPSLGDISGQRFLYHSTDATGADIAVSGAVFQPPGSPPAGGWPVVAWAHGTIGVADTCAPSRWSDFYEYGDYLSALTGHGFVVVATDYEGLGTPGDHPYLDAEAEARGVVDSVKAVHHLIPDVTDAWVSIGHSQGGQAALVAGQYAQDPDLPLAGVVAIAPASSLELLPLALTGSPEQGYLAFAAAGIVATDPTVELADLMGPDALAVSEVLDHGCWYEVMAAFVDVDPAQLSPVTDAGRAAVDAYLGRNEPATSPIDAPVLLVQGGADDTVPEAITGLLRDRLCGHGTVTAMEVYAGLGHDAVLVPSLDDTVAWIQARFAGTAPADGCSTGAG